MKKIKKSGFIEGAFIATFCIIITKVLGIIYVIPFYKIIGERGGILYGYAYNIYNIFLIVSSAGIPLAISKLTSEYTTKGEENKKIRMYSLASKAIIVFSIFSFLVCFIFAKELANMIIGKLEGGNSIEDVTFVIRLISFALLVIPMLSIKRGYLQGHRFIKEPSISQIIEQLARIIIIIVGSYVCVYVFHAPIKYAVGISVFAACIGGIITYIYLSIVTKRSSHQIGLDKDIKTTKKEDREIIKKIIYYSVPFIVINLANTIYTFTDMLLVIKTLPKLGYSAFDTEFITSVFTTWGVKFNTIVSSISTGLIISLIPNMVKDYIEKNYNLVNINFNKCLKIILLIIAPIAIFMSLMSESMWNLFYSYNQFGYMIIRYNIIVTIFDCLYMVLNSLMQSLNESKIIYKSVITGLLLNLILDIPLMNLFYNLNLPAYYGAITATLIGFLVSNIMSIMHLSRIMKLDLSSIKKVLPKYIISIFLFIIVVIFIKSFLNISSNNKLVALFNILLTGIVGGGVYLIINFKNILNILPSKIVNKIPFIRKESIQ